jgi:hypothetical protein
MKIKTLFDPSKDIYRAIEKVITYNASQEARLKSEIREYIVTESIEEQFEKLLTRMQAAMESGGENEVGVWVSGFYGSGKSSFTKYLGLALDDRVEVDGVRFLKHLQDRLNRAPTKALLSTVAARHPTAVVMLDLASEMLAGATMEDVSTVLYYKVLQWAGYSRNLKVAAFERKLQKDGRYDEFTARIQQDLGVEWREVQNDPLVIDSLLPELAHDIYPELFKSPTAFSTVAAEFVVFENERVKEMIEIAREATGKEYIIFIIDEVGQYVASRPNLILNLDGLAKNLKHLGDGKVWILSTAQQTLTEDDPKAAFNSPELYKLKDRFPIQIDLESSDIREICTKRLLGKSPEGEKTLGALFDQHGQGLRHNTKLHDARYYDADFDRKAFVDLYPFLPAHFDVLLHLLGALAKSTGGIGLRSAIKVVQDILVEGPDGETPVADREAGWLATTVTLYDALEKDIRRAAPSIHKALGKVLVRFPDSRLHQEVAKTVAVLQILDNIPVTGQNAASLMHPGVDSPSRRDDVEAAIQELMADPHVPFGEKEGNLCFFSEKLNDIDQERAQITARSLEMRRIQNEALKEAFSPLPSARLHNTLAVSSGLKAAIGAQVSSIAGEREAIQTVVELAGPQDYETARTRLLDESRQKSAQNTIFLLGRHSPEIDDKLVEVYRCREIANRYRTDPDQEVKEYCAGQADRAARIAADLERLLKRLLAQGSFIFRGQQTAVDSLGQDVAEAAKRHLAEVAAQVYDRYVEAPVRPETSLAEKFLRAGNLKAVTAAIDPLGLVQVSGGTPRIRTDHKALVSIRDYVDRNGTVDGKRLTEHFTEAPYGWSPDALRYLVAALLVAGEIRLKVSGREVTVNGQQAIDALRTNQSFRTVGVALRHERPSNVMLARAAERLTDLVGDLVIPLEDEISKTAAKHFPSFQLRYGPLATKLEGLGLPGVDTLRSLSQDLADVLLTDASDAPQRLGGEESPLFESLKLAGRIDTALKNGLEKTIREVKRHASEISALPGSGIPGRLRTDLEEEISLARERLAQEGFFNHAADLSSTLTTLEARTRDAVKEMEGAQKDHLRAAQEELQKLPVWGELTREEQSQTLAELDALAMDASWDLAGLKQLLTREYEIQSRAGELRMRVERLAHERQLERLKEEKERAVREGKQKIARSLAVPARVTKAAELDDLIQRLQSLRAELSAFYGDIEVTLTVGD